MAISDDIQRYMPSAADRDEPHGTPLAYKEAVLLTNPKEPQFKGEVNRPNMLDILYSNKLKFQTETDPWACNSLNFLQVDDKYEYSLDNKDNVVHGWISSSHPNPTGFWVITPSNEFKSGGPMKRELTSHVGPTSLTVGKTSAIPIPIQFQSR